MRDWFNEFFKREQLRGDQALRTKEYLEQLGIFKQECVKPKSTVSEEAERGLIIEGEVVK